MTISCSKKNKEVRARASECNNVPSNRAELSTGGASEEMAQRSLENSSINMQRYTG
jgi:hypothetical protein